MKKPFSLSKNERLKSKKDIDALFLKGKAFFVFPYKVCFIVFENTLLSPFPLQIVATVPKRKFKKATQRNTIRRRLKESYRLNKLDLQNHLKEKNKIMHLLIMYVANEELAYIEMDTKMKKVLEGLIKKVV